MTILVLGDSTSFGAELSDMPVDEFIYTGNEYYCSTDGTHKIVTPSQLAWPAVLGQHLGEPVENLSLVGGSNERIYRLAVDCVSKNTYSLVVCAWTTLGRFDLQYQGRDIGITAQCYFEFDWVKNYVADHYDLGLDFNKWAIQAITLQAYLKQRQQPYLYIKAARLDYIPPNYLADQIDQSNCVRWDSNMYELTDDLPRGPRHHMLEQSHSRVAHIIAEHVKAAA
jgi:hypothetical protein